MKITPSQTVPQFFYTYDSSNTRVSMLFSFGSLFATSKICSDNPSNSWSFNRHLHWGEI